MNLIFRARSDLMRHVRADLSRRHAFAAERVGFLTCRSGRLDDGGLVILAFAYDAVAYEDYLDDPTVGAMMGSAAIRKAMQRAYRCGAADLGLFHIHMHHHRGIPGFSRVDRSENAKFVPDFFNVAPTMPHGAIVLSLDRAAGMCWLQQADQPHPVTRFAMVGGPLQLWGQR